MTGLSAVAVVWLGDVVSVPCRYDTMRGVLEELSGIKIITVDAAEEEVITLNVMLLESYHVLIGLKSDGRDALLVTTAQFSSSVQVSVDDSLELSIPALDDLVQICSTLGRRMKIVR